MTDKQLIDKKARFYKQALNKDRINSKASLKDLRVFVQCQHECNYSPMWNTTLYNKHGGEYCRLLEYTELERKLERVSDSY